MFKSFKNLLGLSLLAFFGVWMGCSSDSSPVSPSNKAVTDDGTATQVSTFTVSPDSTEVVFGDNNLKYEVALTIFGTAEAPAKADIGTFKIYEVDMDSLRVLKAKNKGITSLVGLEHATNLDTLILGSNSITNVDSLAGLTGLVWLDLQRNRIADVSPLANLTNLEALHLYQNSFTDVSSLKTLTKLKRFGIGARRVGAQVGPLVTKMPDLEWLRVNHTGLTDIKFLEELPKLEHLNISLNPDIEDFKPLACLPELKDLHLRGMMNRLAWSTGLDGELLSTDDHIQYLINIGVTIHWRYT